MPFYNYLLSSSVQDGGLHQRIDKQLVTKIKELVISGARNVKEVKRHLKIFVEKELYRNKKAPTEKRSRNGKVNAQMKRSFSTLMSVKNQTASRRKSRRQRRRGRRYGR